MFEVLVLLGCCEEDDVDVVGRGGCEVKDDATDERALRSKEFWVLFWVVVVLKGEDVEGEGSGSDCGF